MDSSRVPNSMYSHSTGIHPKDESLNLWVSSERSLPCSSMPRVRRSCISPVLMRSCLAINASVFSIARSTAESTSAILVCSGLGGRSISIPRISFEERCLTVVADVI